MNHTGEYWFDFGRLDSPHSPASTKSLLEDFQLITKISQNVSNSPCSPSFTDVVHATTIIHSEVVE